MNVLPVFTHASLHYQAFTNETEHILQFYQVNYRFANGFRFGWFDLSSTKNIDVSSVQQLDLFDSRRIIQ